MLVKLTMKSKQFLVWMLLIGTALGVLRTPSASGAVLGTYKFTESEKLVNFDINSYSATINITNYWTGFDLNSLNTNSMFYLSFGGFSTFFYLGDDPSYAPGKTRVTYTSFFA